MHFGIVDWLIVGLVIVGLLAVAAYLRQFTRSVADFLSANRCAGRYLLTISGGMASMGAIQLVAYWEKIYQAGFGAAFWGLFMGPISLVLALSGWIIYRYRQTRALTMAQFFEMRYSRRFRIFAGLLAWISGILNYGIFPAITARLLIHLTGLPEVIVPIPGTGAPLNLTLAGVMFVLLAAALAITLSGGQISVMVTDFLQGLLYAFTFSFVIIFLLWKFGWSNIESALLQAPERMSMVNPLDQADVPDFNFWFYAIAVFMTFYGYMAWQGNQGYNSSAKSPHEAKMAGILGSWRSGVGYAIGLLIPVAAYALFRGSGSESAAARDALGAIADEQVRTQMTTPVALSILLPMGVSGLFAACVIALAVSTDTSCLHSWGSIFIQDVLVPLTNRKLAPEAHLRWLRRSIIGVAVFAFFFSLVFPLKEFILMYFMITGAIFTGGAGAVIIGGLYWNRGTTAGAWSGMLVGCSLSFLGILVNNLLWPLGLPALKSSLPHWHWLGALPEKFWLNGTEIAFFAAVTAFLTYVAVSLLTCRKPFDMDRLLHRGKYADPSDSTPKHQARGWKVFGMGPEFTTGDKVIYIAKFIWTIGFFAASFGILAWNAIHPWTAEAWAKWWYWNIILGIVLSTGTLVWFTLGGARDLKALITALRSESRNAADDGRVEAGSPSAPPKL